MSDQKKPTDSGSTESAATEEPGKELDAEQLENVAGGLRAGTRSDACKFFRPNPTGRRRPGAPDRDSFLRVSQD